MDAHGLAPASANDSKNNVGAKLIALLLMLGGVVGVFLFVKVLIQAAQHGSLMGILNLLGVIIFVWSALTGLSLWLGKPGGYRWAKILFAAQIPIIGVPGLQYWFYTGVNLWLTIRSGISNGVTTHGVGLGFNLGSSLSMWLGLHSTVYMVGINPLAIGILIFLSRVRPVSMQQASEAISPV